MFTFLHFEEDETPAMGLCCVGPSTSRYEHDEEACEFADGVLSSDPGPQTPEQKRVSVKPWDTLPAGKDAKKKAAFIRRRLNLDPLPADVNYSDWSGDVVPALREAFEKERDRRRRHGEEPLAESYTSTTCGGFEAC